MKELKYIEKFQQTTYYRHEITWKVLGLLWTTYPIDLE